MTKQPFNKVHNIKPESLAQTSDPRCARTRYLRLSVTNQCNFNCYYCHNEGQDKKSKSTLLSAADIVWICKTAQKSGFKKFKLTGGEPTLRHDLSSILRGLYDLQLHDLSIITNGSRLAEVLPHLLEAGLPRLNVTLNTMDPARFKRDIHYNPKHLHRVLTGIDAALEVGYRDMKLNFIYHGPRSLPDFHDICDFAAKRDLVIVILPMLRLNPRVGDLEISLAQLHLMCEELGIRGKELITDCEGLQKYLITLNSGSRVLLRLDELGDKNPYLQCGYCEEQYACREGIFPLRISADGFLIPCLAGGRARVDLTKSIFERNRNEFITALNAVQNV